MKILKAHSTGLKQKSTGWAKARKNTIGASEVAALTGHSPFETRKTLLLKKIQPPPVQSNVACCWGTLFEPIARKYFEKKHSVQVFGYSVSFDLAKDHPLYIKSDMQPRRLPFKQRQLHCFVGVQMSFQKEDSNVPNPASLQAANTNRPCI